jgi:hypothetical protein
MVRRLSKRLVLAAAAIVGLGASSPASAVLVYGLDVDNNLFSFDSAAPNAILSGTFVTGLGQNEKLLGIDFRPATGGLYAIGSLNNVYQLNTATGAATLVGSGIGTVISGTAFGVDFNPTVDRIRFTSDTDQNLRINPITGALVSADSALNYAAGDPNAGKNPSIVGSAYTNNFPGAPATVLYGIDSVLDVLVTQNPPNAGILNTVGSLGVNATNLTGFDIFNVNTAYAALQTAAGGVSDFYTLDLTTGAASLVGTIGGGLWVRDIAVTIVPEPSAALLLSLGVAGLARFGSRRKA